jgi:hypothetical protein
MRTYNVNVETANGREDVQLRLTLQGQINLKKKYKKNAVELVFDAIDDCELMADILTEALNFKGNTNTIKTGAELYDAIADTTDGINGFCDVLLGIATDSGLISAKQADVIRRGLDGAVDEAMATIEDKVEGGSKN